MRLETVLRWVARAGGAASTFLLLGFAFGGREYFRPTAGEVVALLLFPGGVVAGFLLAWRRELAGGLLTVGSLALFHLYEFAASGRWWLGPYFLLFAAPGFLHVAAALLGARRGRGPAAAGVAREDG